MTWLALPDVRLLRQRLIEVSLKDERRLARRLDGLRKQRDATKLPQALTAIAQEIDRSAALVSTCSSPNSGWSET